MFGWITFKSKDHHYDAVRDELNLHLAHIPYHKPVLRFSEIRNPHVKMIGRNNLHVTRLNHVIPLFLSPNHHMRIGVPGI